MTDTAYTDMINAVLNNVYKDNRGEIYKIKEIETSRDSNSQLECLWLNSSKTWQRMTFPIEKTHELIRVDKSYLEQLSQSESQVHPFGEYHTGGGLPVNESTNLPHLIRQHPYKPLANASHEDDPTIAQDRHAW